MDPSVHGARWAVRCSAGRRRRSLGRYMGSSAADVTPQAEAAIGIAVGLGTMDIIGLKRNHVLGLKDKMISRPTLHYRTDEAGIPWACPFR
jgi:hypothetical protein